MKVVIKNDQVLGDGRPVVVPQKTFHWLLKNPGETAFVSVDNVMEGFKMTNGISYGSRGINQVVLDKDGNPTKIIDFVFDGFKPKRATYQLCNPKAGDVVVRCEWERNVFGAGVVGNLMEYDPATKEQKKFEYGLTLDPGIFLYLVTPRKRGPSYLYDHIKEMKRSGEIRRRITS